MLSGFAMTASWLTAVVAVFAFTLRDGEAVIVFILVSLGLWDGLYLTVSWLASCGLAVTIGGPPLGRPPLHPRQLALGSALRVGR